MNSQQVALLAKRLGIPRPAEIPGSRIWACQARVTPTMADDWLASFNSKNRNCRDGLVSRHASDMKAGRWIVSHQGIGFDEEQTISSGQHRLRACVLAGIPFDTLIFLNCPTAERNVIDQGAARNVRDVAKLGHGDPVTSDQVMAVRAMMWGIAGYSNTATAQETYELLIRYRKPIAFVLDAMGRKVKGITLAPVIGALCRAYYKMDHTELRKFIEVLVSGISRLRREEVVIQLREKLRKTPDAFSNRAGRVKAYGLTVAALLAYRDNELPTKLVVPDEEPFPLPNFR